METPIFDFVSKYAKSSSLRFHMPGHKGVPFLGCEKNDITEIPGADILYSSSGIIRKSEENAASLFGTARTVYSTEGSSLSIRAMLFLLKLYAQQKSVKPCILAGRNAHKVFITSCALLDIEVKWIFPDDENYISCLITAEKLDEIIKSQNEKPCAVYITSPDYLGNITDIEEISKVCHKHGILLAVDNAHGAYLGFLPESRHPIHLGADLCCDSAHKTLPVLTGGGYLHISKKAPPFFCENAETAMSVFASTSPSYLIMQSLDLANDYIENNFRLELKLICERLKKLKGALFANGFELVGNEDLKITIKTKQYGYTGEELSRLLEKENIFSEFSDPDYIVFMFSTQNSFEQIEKLENVLSEIPRRAEITTSPPKMSLPRQKFRPKDALFSMRREEKIQCSKGKILACATVSCPPAIPIVSLGEEIDESAIKVFEYYGIENIIIIEDGNDI